MAIIIGTRPVELRAPESYSVALDVVAAAARNPTRAMAAALGVCWTGPGRPGGMYERSGYDVMLYGGRVRDALMRMEGVTDDQVAEATVAAFELCTGVLAGPDEVKAAEGNSEPITEPASP